MAMDVERDQPPDTLLKRPFFNEAVGHLTSQCLRPRPPTGYANGLLMLFKDAYQTSHVAGECLPQRQLACD